MPNQRSRRGASHTSFDSASQSSSFNQTPSRNRHGSPQEAIDSSARSRKRTRATPPDETPTRPAKVRRTGNRNSPSLPSVQPSESQEEEGPRTPETLVNDTGYEWDPLPQSKDRSIGTERQREEFRHPGSSSTTSEETSRWPKVLDILRQRGYTKSQQFVHGKIENDEVRLLVLEPLEAINPHGAPITVTLRTVKLQALKTVEFEALSYHWGQEMSKRPIYIVEEPPRDTKDPPSSQRGERFRNVVSSFKPFNVTANLYNALQHLRTHKPTNLWIDAICIQQNRPEEKQIQIGYMGQIYSSAHRVRIWLGNSDDRTNSAMKFIDTVVNLKGEQNYLKDDFIEKWADLQHLIRSEWFSRRWTIQEVALAKTAVVNCGSESQNWRDFRVAISVFVRHIDRIKANFRKQGYDHDAIGEIEGFGAKVLVEVEANMFRRDADGSIFEPAYSLEMLVSSLTSFDTSDPRDTIYSLQNICNESRDGPWSSDFEHPAGDKMKPPDPDYTKTVLQTYMDFVGWVIKTSKSLDIICRHWALPEKGSRAVLPEFNDSSDLPSWILTIDKSTYGLPSDNIQGRRKYGGSFVGLPASRGTYDASYGLHAKSTVGKRGTSALYAFGIRIERIKWTSQQIADGVIPKVVLEKCGWKDEPHKREVPKAPDKVWRTLVADRGPNGARPPPAYGHACTWCLAASYNGHININNLLNKSPPTLVSDYLKRVKDVVWERSFLESESGLIGIASPDIQEGDWICILFGCSVPVILREYQDDRGFQFIGEAFIYGKMDGEAIRRLGNQLKDVKEEFVIT